MVRNTVKCHIFARRAILTRYNNARELMCGSVSVHLIDSMCLRMKSLKTQDSDTRCAEQKSKAARQDAQDKETSQGCCWNRRA